MYDWEISKYLSERNNNISNHEYLYICQTCPQIRQVSYNDWSKMFHIETDNGNSYDFAVYYAGKQMEENNERMD